MEHKNEILSSKNLQAIFLESFCHPYFSFCQKKKFPTMFKLSFLQLEILLLQEVHTDLQVFPK